MENKYARDYINRTLLSIESAPEPIKNSAKFDSSSTRVPYGYLTTDRKHTSSFQNWFGTLNEIYNIIKDCQDLPEFSTMVTIEYLDKNGNPDGANHTSFDDRVESFKDDIDSGRLANADVTLTVFKDPTQTLVESFLNQYC